MIVSNVRVEESVDGVELRAEVRCDTHWVWGDEPFELWYRLPADAAPAPGGDPFVPACLAPALSLGEDLEIDAPLSPQLAAALPEIQDVFRRFHGFATRNVTATLAEGPSVPAAGVGLFTSLGVDSSYSLLKHVDELTHVILVNGFDVYLWEHPRWPPLLENARRVAAALGKQLVAVTTNLRDWSDRIVPWTDVYFGSGLASVALALQPTLGRVYIAAGREQGELVPAGSHPDLDRLWSTDNLELVHDGTEAARSRKIEVIAASDLVLSTLRVCATGEVTDEYNCGRCEKCLRTMIALRAAGALERCATLPNEIDLDAVRAIELTPDSRYFIEDACAALDRGAGDPPLRAALGELLSRA